MTPFLFPATITLLLFFHPLPTISTFVLDIDGEPLRNGGSYNVVPKGFHGGLTLTQKPDNNSPCPFYITRKTACPGIPVKISSPLKVLYIPLSVDVNIVFTNNNATTCMEPLGWRVTPDVTTGQFYVATGGTSTVVTDFFTIEEADENGRSEKYAYKLRYCPSFEGGDEKKCGDVNFFREGFVGITNEEPLFVQFKKANANLD